jgi:PAS domain S-box-containing protein
MSRDLLAVMGFDGTLEAINPAWEATLGFDEATLLARPFPEQVHPDDLAPAASVLERLKRGETVARFEDRLRHADGSWRWIAFRVISHGGSGLFVTSPCGGMCVNIAKLASGEFVFVGHGSGAASAAWRRSWV